MKYIISILAITLVGIIFITLGPASAQISEPCKSEWTIFDNWTLYEGKEIMKPSVSKWAIFDKWTPSETDLMRILKEHKEWLASEEKKGKRANLSGAYLRGANLQGANLKKAFLNRAYLFDADLSGVDLSDADVSNADLRRATLRGANLERADLMGTWLMEANLSNANLINAEMKFAKLEGADLSGAKLIGTNLKMSALDSANLRGANLRRANLREALLKCVNLKEVDASLTDFSGAWFQPVNVEELVFLGAKGFASIQFHNSKPVAKLRQIAKESGLRNEERALTSALYKYRLEAAPIHERILEYCLFGLPTDFGASPWKSVCILAFLIIIFSFYYMIILTGSGKDGIWKIWIPTRVRKELGKKNPMRLTLHGLTALRVGLYFSMLSAFNIGWRELNVGNWLARMQRQEYIYRATGWTRTISGIQSLMSVYLLALWALTYFGRPFE